MAFHFVSHLLVKFWHPKWVLISLLNCTGSTCYTLILAHNLMLAIAQLAYTDKPELSLSLLLGPGKRVACASVAVTLCTARDLYNQVPT